MGQGASKEELIYMSVQRGDLSSIRALRQQGASLEYRDSKGRTPLMIACSRAESFDAAHTLLQLGADIRAYNKGVDGGTPIHYAARKRLTRTVEMLLNYGADPLQRNDMARSALDLAREQHLGPMVRLIEGRVGLFSGLMRQHFLSNSLLKMVIPQWVSRIVWVAVVPYAKGSPHLQLALYPSYEAGSPQTVLILQDHVVMMTKQDTSDPKCSIQNTRTGEKYKFGSEPPDQPAVVHKFFNACHGVSAQTPVQQSPGYAVPAGGSPHYPAAAAPQYPHPGGYPYTPPQGAPPPTQPSPTPGAGAKAASVGAGAVAAGAAVSAGASGRGKAQGKTQSMGDSSRLRDFQSEEIDDDAALKIALAESMRTASAERPGVAEDFNGWGAPSGAPMQETYGGWGDPVPAGTARPNPPPRPEPVTAEGRAAMDSWADARPQGGLGGWGDAGGAPTASPSAPAPSSSTAPSLSAPTAAAAAVAPEAPSSTATAPAVAPSAPPIPAAGLYPTIDTTPVVIDYSAVTAAPQTRAPEPSPILNSQYSEDRVKEELKKAEDKKGGGQCVICWDAPAEAVCVPCGHIAGCMECLNEVKEKKWGCPVCRASIDTVIKVFQVN